MSLVTGYVVNKEGFHINTVVVDISNNTYKESLDVIITPPSIETFLFKRKWNGEEWVEGELEEEKELREYNQYLDSLKPSHQELEKAQLEIEVLNIINELGIGGI